MTTFVTLLRGEPEYSARVLAVFDQLPADKWTLIAGVSNDEDREAVEALGGRAFPLVQWDGQGGEVGRHNWVANAWNFLIAKVGTGRFITMEDDIIPPGNGVYVLQASMSRLEQEAIPIAVVVSPYPFSGEVPVGMPQMAPIFFDENYRPALFSSLTRDTVPIFTGGMGLALFKTSIFKQNALPMQVPLRQGTPMGTDLDYGRKLKDAGFAIYMNGANRCQHV